MKVDKEGLFTFHTQYNVRTNTLKGRWANNFPWTNALKNLNGVMKESLVVRLNGEDFSEESVNTKIDTLTLDIFLDAQRLLTTTWLLPEKKVILIRFKNINSFDFLRFNQMGRSYLKTLAQRDLSQTLPLMLADLHTHFAGALKAKILVEAIHNASQNVFYPIELLEKMEVVFSGTIKNGMIDLANKQSHIMWRKFQQALSIHPLCVSLFPQMEDVYAYRAPIVKQVEFFEFFLTELAKDYQKSHIKYVELSLSDIVKPDWIVIANRMIPLLEEKYNVQIRFLVGIWRHSPHLFNMDMLEKVKCYRHNPYIVGIDIMGHETNSTRDLTLFLNECHAYKEIRPDFVVRVHAGESPCHPENVCLAIESGATRIGHGLSFSSEDAALARESGVIFEINISSNSALHSATLTQEIPIKELIQNHVRVTLGTDGHGCYRTNSRIEARLAMELGLTREEMQMIMFLIRNGREK